MTTTEHTELVQPVPQPPGPERVLFATDGGLAGVAAIRWLAERERHHRMEVTVVNVIDVDETDFDDEVAEEQAHAEQAVQQARDLLLQRAPRLAVRTVVHRGEPVQTVRRQAGDADLVVVGTNRSSRRTPHLLVSFATRLAAVIPSPLVAVPRGWDPSAGPVVVGAEGDGSDAAALEFAAREAEALDRHLVLVHAWRLAAAAVAGPFADDLDRDSLERAASGRLSDLAEQVHEAHPRVRVAPVLGHDEPVHALIRAGSGASLVVVGTHALTGVDRLLVRSVSRGVIERPGCPIAVVPPARPGRG